MLKTLKNLTVNLAYLLMNCPHRLKQIPKIVPGTKGDNAKLTGSFLSRDILFICAIRVASEIVKRL